MKNNGKIPLKGLWFYLIVLGLIIFVAAFFSQGRGQEKLSYSEVLRLVESGKVKGASIQGGQLRVVFKEEQKNGLRQYELPINPYWQEDLQKRLSAVAEKDKDFNYSYQEPMQVSAWINGGISLAMLLSMGFLIWFMLARQNGDGRSAMNFGRSRARMSEPGANKVTFKDVAGAEEEKHELEEVVDFLKNPGRYEVLGARIPRGILLVGPPGTGKTLLAKAVAGEAGVPFFSISGSDFVEMFVGVGASRVRDLFEQAKKNAPAIIFIDEIDAVGRHRGAGMGGGHDEREQTLNQLLVEMDGFGPNEAAIVMAATNRPDILDPALLRPGRFDRRVTVSRPDIKGREEILAVHARNKPLDQDVKLDEVARITPGFTGADLANLLNEAALMAARRQAKTIRYADISEAVFKVMLGPEKKSRIINEKERRLTAYHEAGHALAVRSVSETDRVERVSIIPAGQAGGYTAHKSHEDLMYMTRGQLVAEIVISLAGRAAEEIIFGEVSTGASGDLQHCNKIARSMITRYGMSERLGNMVLGGEDDEVFLGREYGHRTVYSEKLSAEIDEEVRKILSEAYQATLDLLRAREEALEALTQCLLAHEKIDELEFELLYQRHTTAELREQDAQNPGRDQSYVGLLQKLELAGAESAAKLRQRLADMGLLDFAQSEQQRLGLPVAEREVQEAAEPLNLAAGEANQLVEDLEAKLQEADAEKPQTSRSEEHDQA